MDRRSFIQSVILGTLAAPFATRQVRPEYPADWLDWYSRDGTFTAVDHMVGEEFQPGELVRYEDDAIYQVPQRPKAGTVMTVLHSTNTGTRRSRVKYLGQIASL